MEKLFVVTCQRSGMRTLLGLSAILLVHNTDLGPVIAYSCLCDDVEVWHRGVSYPAPEGSWHDSEEAAALVRGSLIVSSVEAGARP